jgi:hypothetical protein
MTRWRVLAALSLISVMVGGPAAAQMPPGAPGPSAPAMNGTATDPMPPRLSYLTGEVSFWRPGAEAWAPAQLNTPLAPGDVLYAAPGANVEIQVGPAGFVRAADGAQISLDNQDADLVQLRMTAGHASLDLRQVPPESAVELDTPNATFTIERAGYYRVDVDQGSTAFGAYRRGAATMTTVDGAATVIASDQQAVVSGKDAPRVMLQAAPTLTAWDRWSQTRTDQLLQASSARYVPPTVYGAEALDQYGTWRTVESYGPVWVPAVVPVGWVPYSTGRWIWDPRFGWTWLDDAPWGWAPFHHGRWIFVDGYWAWAPGPVVVRAVYAPALVVFLDGAISVGRPVCWAPLAWGEPIIPWWGRPGFRGEPHWAGWGGPRVVNNVVVDRSTTINVTNITVYRNVTVTPAVIGVPTEHFGRGHVQAIRVDPQEVRQLRLVHGAPGIRPVAASLAPATGRAIEPAPAIRTRAVVATRPPKDPQSALRAEGLVVSNTPTREAMPRLVPSPRSAKGPGNPAVIPQAPGAAKIPNPAPPMPPPPGAARIPGPPPPLEASTSGRLSHPQPGKEAAPGIFAPAPGTATPPTPPGRREAMMPGRRPPSSLGNEIVPPTPSAPAVKAPGPPAPARAMTPERPRDAAPRQVAPPVIKPEAPGTVRTLGPPPGREAAVTDPRTHGAPAKETGPPALTVPQAPGGAAKAGAPPEQHEATGAKAKGKPNKVDEAGRPVPPGPPPS